VGVPEKLSLGMFLREYIFRGSWNKPNRNTVFKGVTIQGKVRTKMGRVKRGWGVTYLRKRNTLWGLGKREKRKTRDELVEVL